MRRKIATISTYLLSIVLATMTAYSNERLNFSIKANHAEGSAGITYSTGKVQIKWAVTSIEADSIKTDQDNNTFETKYLSGEVFKGKTKIKIDEKLIETVKYKAAYVKREGSTIHLKGNARLTLHNVSIRSAEITIELLPHNP